MYWVKAEINEERRGGKVRLPGVEPGSIAWKAIILTVGLQTPRSKGLTRCSYHRWTINAH